MKKTILTLIATVACVISASAQGLGSLGANFLYGSKFDQVGLGVSYKVNLTENFRIAPEMQYFFSNKNMKTWDANANIEYVSTLFDDLKFYPLVGFTYSHWTQEVKVVHVDKAVNTWDRFGVNIGGGIEYNFTDEIALVAELRGQLIKSYSQCVLSIGVKYNF
ncbi:MAG: outer membrane beta-barrel protein [Muribaculaceae bacterium]